MKRLATLILMVGIFFPCHCFSQNIVPNWSFEVFDTCPNWGSEIYYAFPWFQPNSNYSSSDYFNNCNNDYLVGVPKNFAGYQNARTGNGYAGIILFYDTVDEYREYIEVKLMTPLMQNKNYCVEFYVSLGDVSRFGIDAIHAFFSTDSIWESVLETLPYYPQVKNPTIINDTSNWVLISGEFTANGGEQYLTIGNFFKNDSTNFEITNDSTICQCWGYYYFDDVSVTLCDDSVGVIEKLNKKLIAEIYPNPNNGRMTLEYRLEMSTNATLQIFDLKGALLFTQKLNPEENSIVLDNLALENGIFYYSITVDGKRTINKKLVVIR